MRTELPARAAALPTGSRPSTLGQHLHRAIEDAIVSGALAAGSRIHADDLADHFGVSRIPLREALRALDARGWVVIRPRIGVYVASRSLQTFEQLGEVLLPLERKAGCDAARHRSETDLTHLQQAIDDAAAGAIERCTRFHRSVAAAADNRVLDHLLDGLWKRIAWYGAGREPATTCCQDEHASLLAAIEGRDASRAAELAAAHVRSTLYAVRQQADHWASAAASSDAHTSPRMTAVGRRSDGR
jgi:DNA-binding GntR family transcriptional regulator